MDLSKFERAIEGGLRRVLRPEHDPSATPEFLELHRAVLEEIGQRVQSIGGGRKTFPFSQLSIHIPVLDETQRPYFRQGFSGEEFLREVRQAIRERGAEPPAGLRVDIEIVPEALARAEGRGFHIDYREEPAAPGISTAQSQAVMPLALESARSQAVPARLELSRNRVSLGRVADVTDQNRRLVRRNDIHFPEDTDPANGTVSREHAHIVRDPATGECRVFDDHSSHGTWIVRDGTSITVPPTGRGVLLQVGDELCLGQACLRVIAAPSGAGSRPAADALARRQD